MTPAPKTCARIAALCGAALCSWGSAQPSEQQATCSGPACEDGEDMLLLQLRGGGQGLFREGPLSHSVWRDSLERPFLQKHGLSALQASGVPLTYEKCSMNSSDCSLESMDGKPTLVYPGGHGTSCIYGGPYAFAVVPGSVDKLLYYFQGGGACWEANGAVGKQVVLHCTDTLSWAITTSGLNYGIQNRSNEANPFKEYTVVEPLYCSGDAFMGNTTMESDGSTLTQTGYFNAKAVFEWTKKNFKKELTSFVIAGYSAGTLGTMAWATTLLKTFPAKKATVIMDSYAALFPGATQGATISRWGSCDLPIIPKKLRSDCKEEKLTIQNLVEVAMGKFPNVAFVSIQSKEDSTQVWFYRGMAQSWGMATEMGLTEPAFYEGCNSIYEGFVQKFPNYVPYLVDGDLHCFTQAPEFYTASGRGPSKKASGKGSMLYEWVESVVNRHEGTSACTGPVTPNGGDDVDYCDEKLMKQTLKTAESP